jgi:hypothetical protein
MWMYLCAVTCASGMFIPRYVVATVTDLPKPTTLIQHKGKGRPCTSYHVHCCNTSTHKHCAAWSSVAKNCFFSVTLSTSGMIFEVKLPVQYYIVCINLGELFVCAY